MIPLIYTLTPSLRTTLASIDRLRTTILTTPLPLERKQHLRWEAMVEQIRASLALAGYDISSKYVTDILIQKRSHPTETIILGYQHALATIRRTWAGTQEQPSADVVEILYAHFAFFRSPRLKREVENSYPHYKKLFRLLGSQQEHPVVAASIAHAYLLAVPAEGNNGLVARLVSHLILATHGYDAHEFVVPEREFFTTRETYTRTLEATKEEETLNHWLTYCANATHAAYETTLAALRADNRPGTSHLYTSLNNRQQEILSLLESPKARITNRDVQRKFKVSQITASRDLTRLASLNLIYPHGRGRSVYYTKI